MYFLEKAGINNPEVIVTLSILGVFIGAILLVLIVKFILTVKKQLKINKKWTIYIVHFYLFNIKLSIVDSINWSLS